MKLHELFKNECLNTGIWGPNKRLTGHNGSFVLKVS